MIARESAVKPSGLVLANRPLGTVALEEEQPEVHLSFRTGDSTLGVEIAWYYSSVLSAFELRGAPVDLLISLRDVVFNLRQAWREALSTLPHLLLLLPASGT